MIQMLLLLASLSLRGQDPARTNPEEPYTQRLVRHGVVIDATHEVDPDWTHFTAAVLSQITDHPETRPLRSALAARGFRVVLAGPDQLLTELPEYADDPEVAEAAGLGGNPDEYRIAVRTLHPHILVHELAHGIYHTVIQYQENDGSIEPEVVEAPPRPGTFTHQLHDHYERAMAEGLWRGTYFEAHPDEYWAEGVTLWFRVPQPELADELDAPLSEAQRTLLEQDSRAFLAQRDPRLHQLVDSVFADEDWSTLDLQVRGPQVTPLEVRSVGAEQPPPRPVDATDVERPDFTIRLIGEEDPTACFRPTFNRSVEVFGIPIVATRGTGDADLTHAAHVLAEYLDNDEDGRIDDPRVHAFLVGEGAFLAMFADEREMERQEPDFEAIEAEGYFIGQGLHGTETIPDGPPHQKVRGRFDATIEEVLHLVSNGWEAVHPEAFGYGPGSRLTDAMDRARGGRHLRVPRRYPEEAWYHYDDRTCDYQCMAAEYLYWALTTLNGGQDYPGRASEISDEWECTTPEELAEMDPVVYELLTDERYRLPRRLPDGRYRSTPK